MRVAVQSSGFCHLRGLLGFPSDLIKATRDVALTKRGTWRMNRSQIPYQPPYQDYNAPSQTSWLSHEIQSSWYGLFATVESDNVALRSGSVVAILVNGLILLLLGFEASTEDTWNPIVLAVYIVGIVLAIAFRGRRSHWTMPEFQAVDLTTKKLPPAVFNRLAKRRDLGFIDENDLAVAVGEEGVMEMGGIKGSHKEVTVVY